MPAGPHPRWISAATRLIGSLAQKRATAELRSLVATTPERGSWSFDMDYIKPADVVAAMIDASLKKLTQPPRAAAPVAIPAAAE